jgi:hypothetical protein
MPSEVVVEQPTEVWAQVCLPKSPGFVESLPQYTSSGEEIGKDDAKRFPGSVQFTEREGRLMNSLLSVTVTSQDFHVVNETQTISLSPSHDSGVLVFEVVPTRVAARARLYVGVTQQQEGASVTVAVASVKTRVKASDDAAFPGRWNVSWQDADTPLIGPASGIEIGSSAKTDPVRVEDVLTPSESPKPRELPDPIAPERQPKRPVEPQELSEPEAEWDRPTLSAEPSTGLRDAPSSVRLRVAVGVFLVVAFAVVAFVIWKLLG